MKKPPRKDATINCGKMLKAGIHELILSNFFTNFKFVMIHYSLQIVQIFVIFLGFDNNPGWFILEDESANIGNMGILRRNMPLLGNKVPLIMVESKYTVS